MASPQKARAKSGAICWALRKCSAASSYSKLWSCAKPRRKSACAAAGPEFRKATSPKSCWAVADAEHRSSRIDGIDRKENKVPAPLLIVAPLSETNLADRGAFAANVVPLAPAFPETVSSSSCRWLAPPASRRDRRQNSSVFLQCCIAHSLSWPDQEGSGS